MQGKGMRKCACDGNLVFGIDATPHPIDPVEPLATAHIQAATAIHVPCVRAPYPVDRGSVKAGQIPGDNDQWRGELRGGPTTIYENTYFVGGGHETRIPCYLCARVTYDTNGHEYVTYIATQGNDGFNPRIVCCLDADTGKSVGSCELPMIFRFNMFIPNVVGLFGGRGFDPRYAGFNRQGFMWASLTPTYQNDHHPGRFVYTTGEWHLGYSRRERVFAPTEQENVVATFDGNLNSNLPDGLSFSTSGSVEGNKWTVDGSSPYAGTGRASTNSNVNKPGDCVLTLPVNVTEAGSVRFRWKHDNRIFPDEVPPSVDDKLQFWDNGTKIIEWDHASDTDFDVWGTYTHPLDVGIHILKWVQVRETDNNDLRSAVDEVELLCKILVGEAPEGSSYIRFPAQMSDGGDFWCIGAKWSDDPDNVETGFNIQFEDMLCTGKWTNTITNNNDTDSSPIASDSPLPFGITHPAVLTPDEQVNQLHESEGWGDAPPMPEGSDEPRGRFVDGVDIIAYTRREGFDYVLAKQVWKYKMPLPDTNNYDLADRYVYFDGKRDGWFETVPGWTNIYAFENGDIALASDSAVQYLNADGTVRWQVNADEYRQPGAPIGDMAPNLSGNKNWLQVNFLKLIALTAGADWSAVPDGAYNLSTADIGTPSNDMGTPDDPSDDTPAFREWRWQNFVCPAVSFSRKAYHERGDVPYPPHHTETDPVSGDSFEVEDPPYTSEKLPTVVIHRQLDKRAYFNYAGGEEPPEGWVGADEEGRQYPKPFDKDTAPYMENQYTSQALQDSRFNNVNIPETAMQGYGGGAGTPMYPPMRNFDCVPSCGCGGCSLDPSIGY